MYASRINSHSSIFSSIDAEIERQAMSACDGVPRNTPDTSAIPVFQDIEKRHDHEQFAVEMVGWEGDDDPACPLDQSAVMR